jgi:endoglucanase
MLYQRWTSAIGLLLVWLVLNLFHPHGLATVPAANLKLLDRGVHLGHWFSQGPYDYPATHLQRWLKESDFQTLAKIGGTHVRLAVDPNFLIQPLPPYQSKPERFAYLDQAIAWANQYNLGLIIDIHPNDSREFLNSRESSGLAQLDHLWGVLAERYANQSQRLFYELLNEPQVDDAQAWHNIVRGLVQTIRQRDRRHSIIVAAPGWSNPEDMARLIPDPDTNIIYTFHFYKPMAFTHQGATWVGGLKNVGSLPYPYDAEKFAQAKGQITDPQAQRWLDAYAYEKYDRQKMWQDLQPVRQFRQRYGVPIYCGEMGVYEPKVSVSDRWHWFQDITELLKQEQIGFALWGYRGSLDALKNQPDPAPLDIPLLVRLLTSTRE